MMKKAAGILVVLIALIVTSTPWAQVAAPAEVPAYHAYPPAKGEKLPPIMSASLLPAENRKFTFQPHAYELAAKVPNVLYQQPCYCFCSKSVGHTSLHSCFESVHGSHCSVCLKEAYYAYKMNKAGKSAAQIRAGIMKGDWQQIDLQQAATMN